MALSVFDDQTREPSASDLETALGRTLALWDSLVAHLAAQYPPLSREWSFAGAKWGWSLRLKQKKRTIVYLTPLGGHFMAGFALGEKAAEAARASSLPDSVETAISGARKYAEGRAVRLEVRTQRDLRAVETIAAAKMAN